MYSAVAVDPKTLSWPRSTTVEQAAAEAAAAFGYTGGTPTFQTEDRTVLDRDAGVDTHRDVHVAATIDSATGRRLEVAEFASDADRIDRLEAWLTDPGDVDAIGVEGTGAYGAGLARQLAEVDRPDRRTRRQKGKSDPVDAETAARAELAGTATDRDRWVAAMRRLQARIRG